MPKTAGIILIGNEILSGKVIDANAAYLCRELRELGVEVRRIAVIPDEVALIAEEVAAFSKLFDLVFTSGGVGPTHDDVTIEGVALALGVRVVRDERLVALIARHARGPLNEARLKMAEVPEGAELTADGELVFPAVVVRNIYILPGVPELFRKKFMAIRERFRVAPFFARAFYTLQEEFDIAGGLRAVADAHPQVAVGSYPSFSSPDYRVKVTLESKDGPAVTLSDFRGKKNVVLVFYRGHW